MCDFHSIIVYKDGAIFHKAHNSHSQMVQESGRRENQPNREPFFVEAEWSGEGSIDPSQLIRGQANETQSRAIERHYKNLKDLFDNPKANSGMLFDNGYFASDDYADVRWRVINLPNLDHRIASRLAKMRLYADAKKGVTSLHPEIVLLEGNLNVSGSAKLDALVKVGGYLNVSGSAKLDAPALEEVGGYLNVREKGKLIAPKLKK